MHALYFNHFGGPAVLQYGTVPDPNITDNELLVKMKFIGLNFADIYRRQGNYQLKKHTPYINGYEGVGIIIKVGDKTTKFNIGDTILFVDVPLANAELVAVSETHAIKIPASIDPKLAASVGLQGLTADFLAHDLGQNKPNQSVFIHGISGGVGQILSQILTADGINVSGITSTKEKKQLAIQQGAKNVFFRNSNWLSQNINSFDTVYDGIGTTVNQSVQLLKNRGQLVFFGMAGGNPPTIDLIELLKHSKSILTGDLWDYLPSYSARQARSHRLFKYFAENKISISQPTVFALADGQQAHKLLESGKCIGKILMQP